MGPSFGGIGLKINAARYSDATQRIANIILGRTGIFWGFVFSPGIAAPDAVSQTPDSETG